MTGLEIAAIISMIAGSGMQMYATDRASKKQQQEALISQQRQLAERNQATEAAKRRASDFDPTQRQQNQQEIQQDLTGKFDQQVSQPQITAQGTQIGSTIPNSGGSTDYLVSKAREEAKAKASLHGLAALMGRIGSANELRRKEAVGIGDTAGEIGRIQNGANNIAAIDQIGIGAAGRPSLGLQLAGAALSAYGSGTLAGAGVGKGSTGAAPAVADGPLGSGLWSPAATRSMRSGTLGGVLGSGTWVSPGAPY